MFLRGARAWLTPGVTPKIVKEAALSSVGDSAPGRLIAKRLFF